MDTTKVPEIKLRKVGKDRERKKGGAWWNFGRAGKGWSGATGGAGRAAVAGMPAGGIGMLSMGQLAASIIAVVIGLGAYGMGMQLSPSASAGKGPKVFDAREQVKTETAGGPAGPTLPSGLAMVTGSLDGKTPEQRAAEEAAAKRAAEEEAARKAAEEEAARKAEEDAAKAAEAAAPAVPDPAAMAAAADAGQAKGMGSKFGQLSTGLGGGRSGLAGGAGMSGGVGRNFAPVKAGAANGMGTTKAPGREQAKIITNKKQVSTNKFGRRSKALRQLMETNRRSRSGAANTSLEGAATATDSAFSNNMGATKGVEGGGAGTGGAGAGGDTASSPVTGGPIGGGTSDGTQTQNPGGGVNVTPWQAELDWATRLYTGAMIALLILGIMSAMANTPWTAWMKAIIIAAGALVAAAGAAIGVLGGIMISKGAHGLQGGLWIGAGAAIAVAGISVIVNAAAKAVAAGATTAGIATATTVISGLIGGVAGMAAGSAGGDPSSST